MNAEIKHKMTWGVVRQDFTKLEVDARQLLMVNTVTYINNNLVPLKLKTVDEDCKLVL